MSAPINHGLVADTANLTPNGSIAVGGSGAAPQALHGAAIGTAPRLVTRGESPQHIVVDGQGISRIILNTSKGLQLVEIFRPAEDGVAGAAFVDYLNCSFPLPHYPLGEFFARLFLVLGPAFAPAKERRAGLHGYQESFTLGDSGAFFAKGGNAGTGWLSFSGEACHCIRDWPRLVEFLEDELGARITRLDCAVDDLEGIHTVNHAFALYQQGYFTCGGRPPRMSQAGNWHEPDGRGRTLYIGARENGKLVRVYEKGMQLGDPFHAWVRWELELHSRDRIIPWDAVLAPGKYLAGAYPALGWVDQEQSRIKTLRKTAEISYDVMLRNARHSYGQLIEVAVAIEGSPEKAYEKLRRPGIPRRLNHPSLSTYKGSP